MNSTTPVVQGNVKKQGIMYIINQITAEVLYWHQGATL
jgi:hypothetical protein